MNLTEAMKERHSARQYKKQPLSAEAVSAVRAEIDACNRESGLNIQLVTDEPKVFNGFMAHYGKFSGVRNYIALIEKKDSALDEKCGYYGERLFLKAQQIGLNTCWVAMNQQKFMFMLNGDKVAVKAGKGFCAKLDLGIVKYHFEIGAGKEMFQWE